MNAAQRCTCIAECVPLNTFYVCLVPAGLYRQLPAAILHYLFCACCRLPLQKHGA